MDISNLSENKFNSILYIDRKISLQFLKEKKSTVTYVMGMCDFIDNDELELFIKKLKKALGTSCRCEYEITNKEIINPETQEKEIIKYKKITRCGFNGDNRDRISKILQERGISKDKIQMFV